MSARATERERDPSLASTGQPEVAGHAAYDETVKYWRDISLRCLATTSQSGCMSEVLML